MTTASAAVDSGALFCHPEETAMSAPNGIPPQGACPDREILFAFSVGNLPEAMQETIADHIAGCEGCVAILAEQEDKADSLVAGLRQPLPPGVLFEQPAQQPPAPTRDSGWSTPPPQPPQRLADQPSGIPEPPTLAGYELLDQLGHGGMGEVYRSRDPSLGRDLALKVMRPAYCGDPEAEGRFVREARLTASLQHPGIVPVHNLGRLPDGRLFYTMKLVRGRTLTALLAEGPAEPEVRLAVLLGIFETVCQAVGYAHSKRVIHRDLKPDNVMVGRFGEVQVMDWGLGKLLVPADGSVAPWETGTVIRTETEGEPSKLTQGGMGTPAYMPPEQAGGDVELMDERADVFALGAILCVLLTGQPPYSQADAKEALRRARRADLAEALGRLERCGADAELVSLCRECLVPEREGRPRSAEVVAERVAAYQACVQERLRQSELERVQAQVQAREERKRRKVQLALAGALLLLLVAGGGGGWVWQQLRQARAEDAARRQRNADAATVLAMGEARLLLEQGKKAALGDLGWFRDALAAARKAEELARTGEASEEVRQQAAELTESLKGEMDAAARDRRLLAALLEVRGPSGGPQYVRDEKGQIRVLAPAEPMAGEQFAKAFRDWGLDVDATPLDKAASRLKQRPPPVVTEVVAALDEWASERRRQGGAREQWQPLADLAERLDNPDSKRRELRQILAEGRLPLQRALSLLSAALRPVPIPMATPLAEEHIRLRRLADQTDAATEPVLGLVTLARALRVAGDDALAEHLLRAALRARPKEVVLYNILGHLLVEQEPPRWPEMVECYTAVRALQPEFGIELAVALVRSNRAAEGFALLGRLIAEKPDNPVLYLARGRLMGENNDYDGAVKDFRQAIALDPEYAWAHNNLGVCLRVKGELKEAIEEFEQAIHCNSTFALPHINLGLALGGKGEWDKAINHIQQAIAIHHKLAPAHAAFGFGQGAKGQENELAVAHAVLGFALTGKGKQNEAVKHFRQAIDLDPKVAPAHGALGIFLAFNGELDEGVKHLRQAVALAPNFAPPHASLGYALKWKGELDEAIKHCRLAIALDSKDPTSHETLGESLLLQGSYTDARESVCRALELLPEGNPIRPQVSERLKALDSLLVLEKRLPAILQGQENATNDKEAILLARMCGHKKRHVAAARLYDDAFRAEPPYDEEQRFDAARNAVLAAAGKGEDARLLLDKDVVMFRQCALQWLRDNLTDYDRWAKGKRPLLKQRARTVLGYWQSHTDLASVRDKKALDELPKTERAAWKDLWRNVESLRKQIAEKND
jgi:eukaryotic-like serine/threonine-protein kinase